MDVLTLEVSILVFSVLVSLSIYFSARLLGNRISSELGGPNVDYGTATKLTISILENANDTSKYSTDELKSKYIEVYESVLRSIDKISVDDEIT